MGQLRRATIRESVMSILSSYDLTEISLPQLATLLVLDERQTPMTVKEVAEMLKRSLSATSRLLDQLVASNFLSRREDPQDRRNKLVAITEEGRALIRIIEQRRAEAQMAVLAYLSPEERAEVLRGLSLLAEASRRSLHPNEHSNK